MPKKMPVGVSLIFMCLGLGAHTQALQQNRGLVVLGEISSDDLRRTAHRLSVSEEHVGNGLIALEKATALAMEVPPDNSFIALGQLWVYLDRKLAESITTSPSAGNFMRVAA